MRLGKQRHQHFQPQKWAKYLPVNRLGLLKIVGMFLWTEFSLSAVDFASA
jgi:hypothetical protein